MADSFVNNSSEMYDRKEQPYSQPDQQPVWFVSIIFIQSGIIIIANGFCLLLLFVKRKLTFQRISNIYLCGLISAHTVLGIGAILQTLNVDAELYTLSFAVTLCFVIFICIDKYISIKHPFRYSSMTWKFPAVAIALGLPIQLGVSLVHNFGVKSSYNMMSFCGIAIVILFLGITNFTMYRTVKGQLKKIALTIVSDTNGLQKQRLKNKEMKSLYICMTVVFTFILFWAPWLFMYLYCTAAKTELGKNDTWQLITVISQNLNSIFDSLFNVIFNKELRQAASGILCFRWFRKVVPVSQ